MARKNWKIAYKNVELSPSYHNKKTHEYIAISKKQLGSFDNFKTEKFPFLVESGGSVRHEKWFSTKKQAFRYLKSYMRSH